VRSPLRVSLGICANASAVVDRVVNELGRDLSHGVWDRQQGRLRQLSEFDAGLRLIVDNPR
jgi:hypothetical protein